MTDEAESLGVVDSRDQAITEEVFPDVTDAIRKARESGLPVWLHADSCRSDDLSPSCPCKPVRV